MQGVEEEEERRREGGGRVESVRGNSYDRCIYVLLTWGDARII